MTTTRTTAKALLCGAVLFAVLDTSVFRSGLYGWVAKPDSSAGWVLQRSRFELLAHPHTEQPSVLLLGDSTMAEACSAELLREQLGGRGTVQNGAVPGSTPRVWPLLFDQLTAPPGGWRLVVVGLREYDDDGDCEPLQERSSDLAFVGGWLSVDDALALAGDFEQPAARRDLWLTTLCKAFAWRRDVQDLMASPYQRYREVRRQFGQLRWGQPYAGRGGSMAEVHVDGDRIVGLAPERTEDRTRLEHLVWRRGCVDNGPYRRRWLGELADRVTATGAQVVFVRMPSQVLPRATPRVPNAAVLDELQQRPGVHVLPWDTFADLERPDCFFDALHVNGIARARFSAVLAEQLRARFPHQLGR